MSAQLTNQQRPAWANHSRWRFFAMPLDHDEMWLTLTEAYHRNDSGERFDSRKHFGISSRCSPMEMVGLLKIEDELLRFMKAAELQVKYGKYE